MNSIEEAKVRGYLQYTLHYDPYDCGTIVYCIRSLARMGGHDLDHRFAHAGLGAGPEARIATGIVDRALGGGGCETAMYTVRSEIKKWLQTTAAKGMIY